MSRKRRNTSSAEPESPPAKRQFVERGELGIDRVAQSQPRIDTITGLPGAFPGLPEEHDDSLFYGPAQDGLDYLRMVRSEARGIPQFLTAAQPSASYDEQVQEGFFDEDEAYVAAPEVPRKNNVALSKAEQLYYGSVLSQFQALRNRFLLPPPLHAVQQLPPATPISFPQLSKSAREAWLTYIVQHDPHPVQIASMDVGSVLELLRFLTKRLRQLLQLSGDMQVRRISTWLWATLAKCPDGGELGSEEIADLRDCAKVAKAVSDRLHSTCNNESVSEGTYEHVTTEDDINGIPDEGVDQGDEAVIGSNDLTIYDQNTNLSDHAKLGNRHVILDLIIIIVCETYGQQDLLDLRRRWS